MDIQEKQKKLAKEMPNLIKKYGSQIVTKVVDIEPQDIIPTGSLFLNRALGIGGLVKGRVYELFGMESSGKSTLSLHIIAECQKRGGLAAYVDVEHALDPTYATSIGVDLDNLFFSQPDSAENALNLCYDLICQGVFDIVILDSIAAMVPQKELEGEIGESSMGVIARLMSQTMRKIVPAAATFNCAFLALNQMRNKIGITYGSPLTVPGGEAMKFASSVRMQISYSPNKLTDGSYESNDVKVRILKNKLAPPFQTAEFCIRYGEGIDKVKEIIDDAINKDIVIKSGAWIKYGDTSIQGVDKFRTFLLENESVREEILQQCLELK